MISALRLTFMGIIALAAVAVSSPLALAGDKSRPNFVFFLVDDLGWTDLGCQGSKFYETPNIDKLAASGMRFTCAYTASPVCSPTRASIMTGRHPVRVNITDWIPGRRAPNERLITPEDRDNLALAETTIAEILRRAGYQTFFAGKWHLGSRGHWPTDQGFDINIGGFERGSPPGGYYSPWKNPNLKAKKKGEYLTERLTEESIKFLKTRDKKKPFLLYLSYYNVHTPIQPYKKRVGHYREKAKKQFAGKTPTKKEHEGRTRLRQDNASYASMVAAVDDSVGRVLAALNKMGLDDNTVVIFFSDNGGLSTLQRNRPGPTCILPLRAGKGWLYEGGVRVPLIVRAPGVTKRGSECHVPVISMDFFPTMLDLAGLKQMPKLHADGVNLTPLLRGGNKLDRQALFWHYPHYHGSAWKPGSAMREGDWKLIEFHHYQKVELYNLAKDIGERNNLAKKMPAKTQELLGKLHAWQKRIGAKLPRVNSKTGAKLGESRGAPQIWGRFTRIHQIRFFQTLGLR